MSFGTVGARFGFGLCMMVCTPEKGQDEKD